MKTYLTIEALPSAPVACDMTAAIDTHEERLDEYSRLFAHALVGRDRTANTAMFRFAAKPGVREWIIDLATREAACCGFLTYRITETDAQLEWTTTTTMDGDDSAAARAILDMLYSAADWAGQGPDAMAARLENQGFTFIGPDNTEGYPFAGAELRVATSADRG